MGFKKQQIRGNVSPTIVINLTTTNLHPYNLFKVMFIKLSFNSAFMINYMQKRP